jgi:hypothetical protein
MIERTLGFVATVCVAAGGWLAQRGTGETEANEERSK